MNNFKLDWETGTIYEYNKLLKDYCYRFHFDPSEFEFKNDDDVLDWLHEGEDNEWWETEEGRDGGVYYE